MPARFPLKKKSRARPHRVPLAVGTSRFANSPYQVEDHPYDRGYFDRVLGHASYLYDEAVEDREDYRAGWRAASRELRPAATAGRTRSVRL